MKKIFLLSTLSLATIPAVFAQEDLGGRLAVLITGSASNNTTGRIAILNATPQATPFNTIYIDSSGTNAMRFSGSDSTTGQLSNVGGTQLTFAGAATANSTVNTNTVTTRGVGLINGLGLTYGNGIYSIAATYTGISGNQPRGATFATPSSGTGNWYTADQGGLYIGGSTAPAVTGNFRSAKLYVGSTFIAAADAAAPQVSILSGNTLTGLPGLGANTDLQDFCMTKTNSYFLYDDTYDIMYVLSSTSNTSGTISKYARISGSWVAYGSYNTNFGGFAIAAQHSVYQTYLYVTTGKGALTGNSVIKLVDSSLYNAPINITTANNTTLYTAPSGQIIKGIAFAIQNAILLSSNLLNITARNTGQINTINWSTAQENAGDYMQLARSTDAKTFQVIATINGKGTNSSYTHTDAQPAAGTNYYRLQTTNASGSTTYSSVVSATAAVNSLAINTIAPNPVRRLHFQLSFSNPLAGDCSVVITNELGQTVYDQVQNVEGQNTVSVNLPASVRKGIYYLSLSNKTDHFTKRIVVE